MARICKDGAAASSGSSLVGPRSGGAAAALAAAVVAERQQQRQSSSGSTIGRSMARRRKVAAMKVGGGKHAAFPGLVGIAVGGGVWPVASSVFLFFPHRAGPGNIGGNPGRHACINASSDVGSINPISGVCLERGLGLIVGRPLSNGRVSGRHPRHGYSVDGGSECYVGEHRPCKH